MEHGHIYRLVRVCCPSRLFDSLYIRAIMNAMLEIFPWIEKALALRKTKAVFFMSKSKSLIRFVEKRLGFVRDRVMDGEWKVVRSLI